MKAHAFEWYGRQVLTFYRQGRYREALEVARQAWQDCPEHDYDILWWLACLYSRTGELERSLEAFQEALKRGYWWHEQLLLDDPDLEPLHGHAEFQGILAECASRRHAAQAQSKPELLVLTPSSSLLEHPPPLLIALHARGGNAPDFAPYWEPILTQGWLLAVPQSSQVFSHRGLCWDNYDQAQQELTDAFEKIRSTHTFDLNRVILAGFSQGASLAILTALQDHPISCRGCIAVVPAFRNLDRALLLAKQAAKRLRVVLMTGDQDRYYAQTQQFYTEALRQGLECQLWVEPGLGHEFPPDFAAKLLQALDFIVS